MRTAAIIRDSRWLHTLAAGVLLIATMPNMALMAQGLDGQDVIDAIVGAEVKEEESQAEINQDRILAAIDKTTDNITIIRKTTKLDAVAIVYLPDATMAKGGPPSEIGKRIEANKADIATLRQELEGNALLYHAIDSRSILPRDVLAVQFDDQNGVVIFAAAQPAK